MTAAEQPRSVRAGTTTAPHEAWALEGRPLWTRTLLVVLLALAFFTFLYAPSPLIYDADSYYHLAVARDYAQNGISRQLKWVRFGLLANQFGDKEILFHLLLAPFAAWTEPSLGGRLALALLGAALLGVIGYLSLRAIGRWGVIVPLLLCLGSMEFVWRLVRLRPELASLLLLLLALWAAAHRRSAVVGGLALLYALTYTAVHAFVGLFVLIFLGYRWLDGRWEWRLLVYPLLGAGIGLLIHPQFPDNLAVWWFQSVEYFRFKGTLDVGTEIQPLPIHLTLLLNAGWLMGLAILWGASVEKSARRSAEASLAFGIAALVFGTLYLMMSRFALYFVAFATLWLLFEIHRRGRELSSELRLPRRHRLPVVAAWWICLLLSLPIAGYELRRYRYRNSPGPENARIVDRERFAAALPEGAKVANPWRSTPIYMFWAPQGRYLNVLDPVFLAAADPAVHRAQEEIFAGRETDPPLVAATALDSRFIAFSRATGSPTLIRRLLADPRIEVLHDQIQVLFGIRAPTSSPFVLDWRIVPSGSELPPKPDADLQGWADYPRLADEDLRGLEGYVDARRVVGADSCLGLVSSIALSVQTKVSYEFAPSGPSTLWLGERQLLQIERPSHAVLGDGTVLDLELAAGSQRLTVLTCPDPETRRCGFYLLERPKV